MEAKDTVPNVIDLITMGLDVEIMSINSKDDGIKALREHLLHQAEISFKVGWGEGVKVGQLAGLDNGRREVVEWLTGENLKHGMLIDGSFIIAKMDADRWQTKLKDWKIKLP